MTSPNTTTVDGKRYVKPTFKERLIAWWEGYELQLKVVDDVAIKTKDRDPVETEKESRYSPRIECLIQVWGEGFVSAGDAEFCCDLVRPIGLTDELSMLDLGAGLGGPARAISKEFGVWIAGMENDREFAKIGMEMSTAAGMAKKAPVSIFDPEQADLPERKYDCVFSKELLYRVQDKHELARRIEKSLKYGGHLLCVDFVAAYGRRNKPPLKQWSAEEPTRPFLFTAGQMNDMMIESGLEPRVARDITEDYLEQVKRTWNNWQQIIEAIGEFSNKDDIMQALLSELQLWTRRSEVIEGGDLKVYSFHSTKRSSAKSMSDW